MSAEPVAYPPTTGASRRGAYLRHHLWRLVYGSTGGLTVTGPLPSGPAVLVANHSSHADTAALMAAVPAAGRPVFAAAADYWFATPVRRFLVTTLSAAVPVQRHADGAYAALLEACEPVAASGGIVIVYPEGTRSTDGSVGRFASGAARLAADLRVPLVPVALLGTRDVLAKHGTFQAVPVEVRFGAAEAAGERGAASERSAALRERVAGLLGSAPMADPRSPLGLRVERFVEGPGGLVAGFAWGFAEAVSWPVIAEVSIGLLAVTVPRRMVRFGFAVAAGSVAGSLTTAAFARRGILTPAPLTTPLMRDEARRHLSTEGVVGVRHQAFNGIPIKVYAREAGLLGLPAAVVRSGRRGRADRPHRRYRGGGIGGGAADPGARTTPLRDLRTRRRRGVGRGRLGHPAPVAVIRGQICASSDAARSQLNSRARSHTSRLRSA